MGRSLTELDASVPMKASVGTYAFASSAPASASSRATGGARAAMSAATGGGGHAEKRRVMRVTVRGRTMSVPLSAATLGSSLRSILLREEVSPHNGNAKLVNCRGLGTCGTCAVRVKEGSVLPARRTNIERMRLNFPPHTEAHDLRLSCQILLDPDCEHLVLEKLTGFWGQKVAEVSPEPPEDFQLPFGEVEFAVDYIRSTLRSEEQD